MTAPRQVLPNTTYLITRRCSERRFFLRPSKIIDAIFLYVLAVAALRHGVQVHVACVLSNHYHLLVTDVRANLPAFMQYLDSLVARASNAALGRWEGFWSAEASYSAVAPGDRSDIVRKAAYVLANPVAAGLVRSAREWPGVWTAPESLGIATITVRRPDVFFSATGGMPESAELVLTTPPGFASAEEFKELVVAELGQLEHDARKVHPTFLGRARVLAQNPFGRPAGGEPRRELSPRVAARDKWKRVEALLRLKEFLTDYRDAWRALKAGVRDAVFPAGTYQLRIDHGVRCAEPALAA